MDLPSDIIFQEVPFNTFRDYLRQVARDTKQLLSEFPTTPEFHLWENPVADRAIGFPALRTGSRLVSTDLLFHASDGRNLVCDGNVLIDAGISKARRLWLLYRYDSLTQFDGSSGYTSVLGVITAIVDPNTTVHVGFDWSGVDDLNRLTFDVDEPKIQSTVLCRKNWRALHVLEYPSERLARR